MRCDVADIFRYVGKWAPYLCVVYTVRCTQLYSNNPCSAVINVWPRPPHRCPWYGLVVVVVVRWTCTKTVIMHVMILRVICNVSWSYVMNKHVNLQNESKCNCKGCRFCHAEFFSPAKTSVKKLIALTTVTDCAMNWAELTQHKDYLPKYLSYLHQCMWLIVHALSTSSFMCITCSPTS